MSTFLYCISIVIVFPFYGAMILENVWETQYQNILITQNEKYGCSRHFQVSRVLLMNSSSNFSREWFSLAALLKIPYPCCLYLALISTSILNILLYQDAKSCRFQPTRSPCQTTLICKQNMANIFLDSG